MISCTKPVNVEVGMSRPIETVSHAMYPVDQTRKSDMLLELLRETGNGQVLIFTRTKHRAKRLAEQLIKSGLSATSLQGNLSQNRRQEAMDRFRTGRVKVMVATDIAARGIDVSQVTHVINFDMPDTAEAYTHRTGRTGRMERLGTALSLVTYEDMRHGAHHRAPAQCTDGTATHGRVRDQPGRRGGTFGARATCAAEPRAAEPGAAPPAAALPARRRAELNSRISRVLQNFRPPLKPNSGGLFYHRERPSWWVGARAGSAVF